MVVRPVAVRGFCYRRKRRREGAYGHSGISVYLNKGVSVGFILAV